MLSAPPKQFIAVVKTLSPEQSKTIKEIIVNLLQGNLDVSSVQINKLRKYKGLLRQITNKQKFDLSKHSTVLYKVFMIVKPNVLELFNCK